MKPFGIAVMAYKDLFTKNYTLGSREEPGRTYHVAVNIPTEGMARPEIDEYCNNFGFSPKIKVYFFDTLADAEAAALKMASNMVGLHCILFESRTMYHCAAMPPSKTKFSEKGMVPA